MVNIELATKVRDFLRDNPDRHLQSSWGRVLSDGTIVGCVATFSALIHTGGEPNRLHSAAVEGVKCFEDIRTPDGITEWVWDVAQYALGITRMEANFMFDAMNTHNEVLAMLDSLIEHGELRDGLISGGSENGPMAVWGQGYWAHD